MKLQIYPSTHIEWPEAADAPGEDSEFDDAHITINGDRMTIGRKVESGRVQVVDTLTEISIKGSGERTTVVGKSEFMKDRIGLVEDDTEVAVVFDGSDKKCLT
jgi:hypothetical protein